MRRCGVDWSGKLVDRQDLWPQAERLAGRLSRYSQMVLSCAKQAVTRGLDLTLEQGLELEARLGDYLLSVAD